MSILHDNYLFNLGADKVFLGHQKKFFLRNKKRKTTNWTSYKLEIAVLYKALLVK